MKYSHLQPSVYTAAIDEVSLKPSLRVTVTLKNFGQEANWQGFDFGRSSQIETTIPAKTGRIFAHFTG
jgi:hypothetical protein